MDIIVCYNKEEYIGLDILMLLSDICDIFGLNNIKINIFC